MATACTRTQSGNAAEVECETEALFASARLLSSARARLPQNHRFTLRPLHRTDFHKGFASLLSELTNVVGLTEERFSACFDELKRSGKYFVVVVEDLDKRKLVATGTLLLEDKFSHNTGRVGHIEDVVVDSAYRKHKFGFIVVEQLKHLAWTSGCYKIVLDSAERNVGFYQRCGFSTKEIQMVLYKPKL